MHNSRRTAARPVDICATAERYSARSYDVPRRLRERANRLQDEPTEAAELLRKEARSRSCFNHVTVIAATIRRIRSSGAK